MVMKRFSIVECRGIARGVMRNTLFRLTTQHIPRCALFSAFPLMLCKAPRFTVAGDVRNTASAEFGMFGIRADVVPMVPATDAFSVIRR